MHGGRLLLVGVLNVDWVLNLVLRVAEALLDVLVVAQLLFVLTQRLLVLKPLLVELMPSFVELQLLLLLVHQLLRNVSLLGVIVLLLHLAVKLWLWLAVDVQDLWLWRWAVSFVPRSSFSDEIRLRLRSMRRILAFKLVEVFGDSVFLFLLRLLGLEADGSLRCLKIDRKFVVRFWLLNVVLL